jgi:hypothetical protein
MKAEEARKICDDYWITTYQSEINLVISKISEACAKGESSLDVLEISHDVAINGKYLARSILDYRNDIWSAIIRWAKLNGYKVDEKDHRYIRW